MKKILLLPLFGLSFMACSVDPIELELNENKAHERNAVFEDACAGPDNSLTITFSEAAAIESWDEVRKLYLSLLVPGVLRNGTFDPSIWDLINRFQDQGLGDYTTEYTVVDGDCTDSVMLTVTVIPDDQSDPPCEPVDAGPENSLTITFSQAAAIESWDEVRKLYLSLLSPGVLRNGTFDPSIWDLINRFQDQGLGDYTTEYSIGEGECTDSVMLTVNVIPDEQSEPPCEPVDAGPDNSVTITYSQAAAIESWDEVRKLYLSLLAPGVLRNGTFDPSIWDLINRFQDQGTGDYTTKYTIGEGECTNSVMLTVTVIPDEQSEPPCEPVNAGPDNSVTITYSQAAGIESWDEVRKLYLSLLAPGVLRNGIFDPSIWDLINRFQDQGPGDYTTEYTIGDGECTDSVLLTVSVIPD